MQSKWKTILERVWKDETFKKRVLQDPASVAKEYGLPIPEGVQVKVHENTDKTIHIILPQKKSSHQLSEAEIKMINAAGSNGNK